MKDGMGRSIDCLRISITDRCNLRCVYCMPAEGVPLMKQGEILTLEEIACIAAVMAELGARHVRLTGGEPLVRLGCAGLVRMLRKSPGIETVSLTTNGTLLADHLPELTAAGLTGVNISLDTLDPAKFAEITRGGELNRTLAGLEAALAVPGLTVKVNCVLAGECWESTAVQVAELARNKNLHVRFIEQMPVDTAAVTPVREEQVRQALERAFGAALPAAAPQGSGPARYLTFAGFAGTVGFISAMSRRFCADCRRIRLTADGRLRLCLQSADGVNLRDILRRQGLDALPPAILDALRRKPEGHCFGAAGICAAGMTQIGG